MTVPTGVRTLLEFIAWVVHTHQVRRCSRVLCCFHPFFSASGLLSTSGPLNTLPSADPQRPVSGAYRSVPLPGVLNVPTSTRNREFSESRETWAQL